MVATNARKIAIIGGGVTGLSLAYYLQNPSEQNTAPNKKPIISVFEPGHLGGMIATKVTDDGYILECGPNVIVFKKEIQELAARLQLKPIFPKNYRQQVFSEDALHDVPKSFLKFLFSKLLSTKAKMQCLKALFHKPFTKVEAGQSIANFFAPLGDEILWKLVDPAIQGVYGGDIKKLCAKSIFPELWSSVSEGKSLFQYIRQRVKVLKGMRRVGTIEGGLETLCTKLATTLGRAVITRKVLSVKPAKDQFEIISIDGKNISTREIFDVVCITTSAKTAASIFDYTSSLRAKAEKLQTIPLSVLQMELSEDSALQCGSFGALWPSTIKSDFKGFIQNTELFPHTAPKGKHFITCMVGGEFGQRANDTHLMELCTKSLAPFSIKPVRMLKVTRWPKAIPQYDNAHSEFIEEIYHMMNAQPGFYFLGSEVGGVGIADRVAIAKKVSDEIARKYL